MAGGGDAMLRCAYVSFIVTLVALVARTQADLLNTTELANHYYGSDAAWFQQSIPFLETSDTRIQDVYYYRWDVVNKHRLWVPDKQRWVFTEFYQPVFWESADRTIVASAAHQIRETRWLRDRSYDNSYVDYWARGYGNAYQYSSWLADATWQHYLATGDATTAVPYLQFLKDNYQNWTNLRFDASRGMFWQRPGQDATEFSVADLMTGGAGGGNAYRPTTNSYMYANAIAISHIATLAGDSATAADFADRAAALKTRLQTELWNPTTSHFTDRFTSAYPSLDYQFIDSRELAGMIPWNFEMPDDTAQFASAWAKVFDSATGFLGAHGLRTVEVTSPHYMNPVASPSAPEFNTWNGPSWPFYTSMVLNGLANMLDDYSNHSLTREQYVSLLRRYTLEQYKDGHPYVAEELDPDIGAWLVDVPGRSEHYFHSTYDDLIITGLAGLRPRADAVLEVNPLIDSSIDYLAIEDIPYHEHEITIIWDTQNHFGRGTGLHVLVNGHEVASSASIQRITANLPTVGDANFDGIVDISDLAALATHWQTVGEWIDGDFDHSGIVDISDLALLATHWQQETDLSSAAAALGLPAVPEPRAAWFIAVVGLALTRRAADARSPMRVKHLTRPA